MRRDSPFVPVAVDPFAHTQVSAAGSSQAMADELETTRAFGPTSASPVPADETRTLEERRGDTTASSYPVNAQQHGAKTRTMAELRAARESRANEALKMKNEQLRILQQQNNQLLSNLDR